MESYTTILAPAKGFYKEKGSKFISFAIPVTSEKNAKEEIEKIRKQYHDARHHCYAYILGKEAAIYKANDDGEPGHSAGDPILRQIRSKELTDTLVIVVRYFGGTKLGVSGLVNAYRTAAQEALSVAELVEITITIPVILKFSYEITNQVMKLVDDLNIEIAEQTFLESCTITGRIQPKYCEALKNKSALIKELQISLED